MKTDYSPDHFERLFKLEEKNFWFRSRNRIIKRLFSQYLPPSKTAKILEVGCGTGFVLYGLSEFKNYHLFGGELHVEGLRYARERLPHAEFIQLDFRKTPFHNEFDAIGAFDVLEHVEEDILMMENVHKSLKPGELFFVSVPQHKWLWSNQDVAAYHKRRYTRKELILKLEQNHFSIEFATSFVFTLLPAMFLSRLFRKKKIRNPDGMEYSFHELTLPSALNKLLEGFMKIDELLIRRGYSLPIGGSLIAVSRKK